MQDEKHKRRGFSRRDFMKAGAAGVAVTGLGIPLVAEQAAANPITAENNKSGDVGWVPTRAPGRSIEGYASETSISPGGTVEFHVSTKPPQCYRVEIYRLGWYSGKGGRLVEHLPEMQGTTYPQPDPDPETGKIECD